MDANRQRNAESAALLLLFASEVEGMLRPMGNNAIIIRTVGCHQNGRAYDAERLGARFVDELRSHGHSILTAHVETGGSSYDAAIPDGESWRGPELIDPETYGQHAYERYIYATGGKSLVSGAELPPFASLSPEIRKAWVAAANPNAPRLVR